MRRVDQVHPGVAQLLGLLRRPAQAVQVVNVHPAAAHGVGDAGGADVHQHLGAQEQRLHALGRPLEPDGAGGVAALAAAGAHVGHAGRCVGDFPRLADAGCGFQRRVDEDFADFQPLLALDVPQQDVDLDHVLGPFHLGQQDAVQVRAGHGLQVVAGQAGLEAVDAHHDGLARLAQLLHHAAHRLARGGLLRHGHRVLEV